MRRRVEESAGSPSGKKGEEEEEEEDGRDCGLERFDHSLFLPRLRAKLIQLVVASFTCDQENEKAATTRHEHSCNNPRARENRWPERHSFKVL